MKKILVKLLLALVIGFPFSSFGQYSVQTGGSGLFPLPDKGVVSISSRDGYLDKVVLYDESGSVREVQSLATERVGDFGDFVLSGQDLYVAPTYWVDYDVIADLGFNLLSVTTDSVAMVYNSPTQYANLISEKSLGAGSSSGNLAISEGDSLHIISPLGVLVNSVVLPLEYRFTEFVDLSSSVSAYEYALVCVEGQSNAILYLDALGEVMSTENLRSRSLGTWSSNGSPILFFEDGYMVLGSGDLVAYPTALNQIEAAYDALEVAVVRNDDGQYFSFTPNGGFNAIGNVIDINFDKIYKRPEGWYSFISGILTFDSDVLTAPPPNPLSFSISADSAIIRVMYSGPMNIPTTDYIVSYTLLLTNNSSESVSVVALETFGPSGSYDPMNRSASAASDEFVSLSPGEVATLSGVYTYTLPGNIPEARAGIYSCIVRINDAPFLGGEPSCDFDVTARVSYNEELSAGNNLVVEVFPNPIQREFNLTTRSDIQSLQLINATGQIIQQFGGSLSKTYQLGEHIASGLYTLQIYFSNGDKASEKVLISQ